MRYEGSIYRPPSEADSLIVQATIGCAHNRCTFCSMYKDKTFRARPEKEVLEDLMDARQRYGVVRRIFIADGNALILSTERLLRMLHFIRTTFPECERVSLYAAPKDLLDKTVEELRSLKDAGLGILYMGIESGSDAVLRVIEKGVTAAEMIEAGQRAMKSGLILSTMIISGLGGREQWQEHAMASAKILSAIDPQYVGLLTLLVEEGTPLSQAVRDGRFELLSAHEVLKETKLLLENLKVTDCTFRSNHASNYVLLKGQLPKDQERLISELNSALTLSESRFDGSWRRL